MIKRSHLQSDRPGLKLSPLCISYVPDKVHVSLTLRVSPYRGANSTTPSLGVCEGGKCMSNSRRTDGSVCSAARSSYVSAIIHEWDAYCRVMIWSNYGTDFQFFHLYSGAGTNYLIDLM